MAAMAEAAAVEAAAVEAAAVEATVAAEAKVAAEAAAAAEGAAAAAQVVLATTKVTATAGAAATQTALWPAAPGPGASAAASAASADVIVAASEPSMDYITVVDEAEVIAMPAAGDNDAARCCPKACQLCDEAAYGLMVDCSCCSSKFHMNCIRLPRKKRKMGAGSSSYICADCTSAAPS
jgi:hypothetical protein